MLQTRSTELIAVDMCRWCFRKRIKQLGVDAVWWIVISWFIALGEGIQHHFHGYKWHSIVAPISPIKFITKNIWLYSGISFPDKTDYFRTSFSLLSAVKLDCDFVKFSSLSVFYRTRFLHISARFGSFHCRFRLNAKHFSYCSLSRVLSYWH